MERREFLRASGLVVLGAVAASCAKKNKLVPGKATFDDVLAGRQQKVQLISAGTEILSKQNERVAFGLFNAGTQERIINATGDVWVAADRVHPALGPFRFTYHGDGLGEKGIYETFINFPTVGQWLMIAEVTPPGSKTQIVGYAPLQVGRQTQMPVVGDPAPRVATPTFADHRGVSPICTRVPMCSMHAISLDAALKNGKPTVVIISTPAFCQSQLCGPETDLVNAAALQNAGRANFIHIEVYKDNKPQTIQRQILSPAAAAWKLEMEPAIYGIDTAGVIKQRALGPFDRADVESFVSTLLA